MWIGNLNLGHLVVMSSRSIKRITNILVKVQAETTKRSTVFLVQVYWYLLFGCTPVFTAPDPGKPSLVVKAFKT